MMANQSSFLRSRKLKTELTTQIWTMNMPLLLVFRPSQEPVPFDFWHPSSNRSGMATSQNVTCPTPLGETISQFSSTLAFKLIPIHTTIPRPLDSTATECLPISWLPQTTPFLFCTPVPITLPELTQPPSSGPKSAPL